MLQSVSRLCAVNLISKILPFSLPRYENYSGRWRTVDASSDPRITLIKVDENVDIVNLSEAIEKAAEEKLKLVKITDLDLKTRRPLYRLMASDHYLQEKTKARQLKKEAKNEFSIKGLKTIIMSSNIGEHDFNTKCRNLSKWLQKHYEIKVTIQQSGKGDSSENLFKRLSGEISEKYKVTQKVSKETNLKFYMKPLPPTEEETAAIGPNLEKTTDSDSKVEDGNVIDPQTEGDGNVVKNPQTDGQEKQKENL